MRRILLILIFFVATPAYAKPAPAELEVPGTFPRPAELEPDIDFWRRVYTEVTTREGLIHDARRLDVVYEVVRFPSGASRHTRRRMVREAKRRYRTILRHLAAGAREDPSPEERHVLALWGEDVDDRTLRRARRRLRFQLGQADKFRAGLVRSGAWEGHIRRTLREMGLPVELAALPHVESSFNPEARSRVGAAGLWQFTRSTGRRYMRIDHVVDERMDPFKSTEAAARLLKDNLSVLGSWPLAITAYNHGAAGMRRATRELKTRDIDEIVRRYRSRTFGFASRNFYAAFLAAVDVDFHAERYFGDLERDAPVDYAVARVPDYMRAETVARALDVPARVLSRCNPDLQNTVWDGSKFLPRGFGLRVPRGRTDGDPAARLAAVPKTERYARQQPDRYHRVRRGQTLSMIAARYGIGVRELVHLNGLRSRNFIRAGQVLRLPGAGGSVPTLAARAPGEPTEAMPEDGTYTVRRGDTVWGIARRFGLSQWELADRNALGDRRRIYPGQTLRVAFDTTGDGTAAAPDGEDAEEPEGGGIAGRTAARAAEAAADEAASREPAEAAAEDAEPMSAEEANALAPGQPSAAPAELSADPSDYQVAEDRTIEVQAAETLGHYAEWLDLRASRLRRVNGMRYGQPVVVGRRLELDFSRVKPERFQQRRMAYHRLLQDAYFQDFRITGVQTYRVRPGDSLWTLAKRRADVPVWLLRQYNPDLDFDALRVGTAVRIPSVEHREEGAQPAASDGDQVARR